MVNIEEAIKASAEFLKNSLKVEGIKVIKVVRVDDGWETEAEVFEESSFIKSIGLPTKIQDRNIYKVKLNEDLEVIAYEKKEGESVNE